MNLFCMAGLIGRRDPAHRNAADEKVAGVGGASGETADLCIRSSGPAPIRLNLGLFQSIVVVRRRRQRAVRMPPSADLVLRSAPIRISKFSRTITPPPPCYKVWPVDGDRVPILDVLEAKMEKRLVTDAVFKSVSYVFGARI
uniref:Uncharacterized protein n=1 Tax=Plectus sambesii TaxID=2011161 RepID=A0A914WJK8_9BILA